MLYGQEPADPALMRIRLNIVMHRKTMDKVKVILFIVFVSAVIGCAKETPALTAEPVNVYPSEENAAYHEELNHPVPVAIESLAKGVVVTVLDDHYGKDYWACHVRTASSTEGWVLCTSLDYRPGK